MRFGFARTDITPRLGVQMLGYGPYLNRCARAVRDPLYARVMAVSDGNDTLIMVSLELCGTSAELSQAIRQRVQAATGVAPDHICVHSIHTHSGPAAYPTLGWSEMDPPYLELLPHRVAAACAEAVANLRPAELRRATVPCVGIGYDREKLPRPEPAECLREGWEPESPETTDTTAEVLTVWDDGGLRGFVTYFSCHPVVGSGDSSYVHGDFVGVATGQLEREHPGSVGLFLQGCHGNINTCAVHYDEAGSLRALDILASRYARQVRPGMTAGEALVDGTLAAITRSCALPLDPVPEEELRAQLAEREAILAAPGASDGDHEVRMATVYAAALRRELERLASGGPAIDRAELQGFRIGPLVLVGAPFELMHRYKRSVQAACPEPTLVLSLCNGALGYAPEVECFSPDNYAARMVPYLLGMTPFSSDIEAALVEALTALARDLRAS